MSAGSLRWEAAALVAMAALVAVAASVGLFAFVPAVIWSLVAICRAYTRSARKRATAARPHAPAGFRYHLCAQGVLYLVPIGIGATFYVLLALYISWFGGSLSVDSLIALQTAFEDVSAFFADNLKLTEVEVLAVLFAIYLLSCVLLSRWRRGGARAGAAPGTGRRTRFRERLVVTLHRVVDVYGKYSGPIAAGLATLASLTFFGMQLGEPSDDLRLRVKVVQEGYAEIAERTQAELSERVSTKLYAKVKSRFPMSYRTALRLPARIEDLAVDVQHHVDDVESRHGVQVPTVERALQRATATAGIEEVDWPENELRVDDDGRRSAAPGSTTGDQVEAARDNLGSRQRPQGIELISDGHKRVTLHVEKLVGERVVMLTRPLTEAVPILDPLIQAFAEVADTTLQERMEQAYDRAMDAAMRNPEDLEAIVEREARAVVADTDVEPVVERAAPQAEQQAEKLKQTASMLEEAKPLIDRQAADHLAARRPKAPPEGSARGPKPGPLLSRHLPEISRPLPSDLYRPHLYRPRIRRYSPWSDSIDPPRTYTPPKLRPPSFRPRFFLPRFFFW